MELYRSRLLNKYLMQTLSIYKLKRVLKTAPVFVDSRAFCFWQQTIISSNECRPMLVKVVRACG